MLDTPTSSEKTEKGLLLFHDKQQEKEEEMKHSENVFIYVLVSSISLLLSAAIHRQRFSFMV